jgi:D-3-phosphoglycerate dehydrogenase
VVIVGRYGFNADAFHFAPKLKMISLWQTGYDNVDLALNLMRMVHAADINLRKGNFDWRALTGNELMNKTLGVLGTGNTGRRVIQIAHGFNECALNYRSSQLGEGKEAGSKVR